MSDGLDGAVDLGRELGLFSPRTARVVRAALEAGQLGPEPETVAQALGLQPEILIALQLVAGEAARGARLESAPRSTLQQGTLPVRRWFGRRPLAQLGKYQVLSEFARGGMGVLYQAVDPDLERVVALKVLRDLEQEDGELIERLRREATLSARLSHPNIITVHEVGAAVEESSGRLVHYIAMDFIDGQTLAEALGGLPLDRRLQILEETAEAVGHAHAAGVVHRDLKPSNILLARDGRPIVTDFGLARGEGAEQLTRSGTVIGTDAYMAPEQVLALDGSIDARTDVWALGVLLYEALTGALPFRGQAAAEIYEQVLHFNPVPPRRLAPGVPRDLQTICLKALEKDRMRRYADGAALAADLGRWRAGRPIEARPPSWRYRLVKWIGRNRAAVAATAIVLGVLGASFAGWQLHRRRQVAGQLAQARSAALLGRHQRAIESYAAVLAIEPGNRAAVAGQAEARVALRQQTLAESRRGEARQGLSEARARLAQAEGAPGQALAAYLAACSRLDRVLVLSPDSDEARALRIRAGQGLCRTALAGGDFTLAERAARDLAAFGVAEPEVQGLVDEVRQTRGRQAAQRAARLRSMLDELARGLSRPERPRGAPTLEDYVFEAVAFREEQTVRILGDALRALAAKARVAGRKAVWNQSERDRAVFACRVLGRIGLPSATAPLAEWLSVVWDRELAVTVGLALCDTRQAAAHPALAAARGRLSADSPAWQQIAPALVRLPLPREAALDAAALRRRAMLRMDRGELAAAIADFERGLALEPDNPALLNLCGLAYFQHGRLDQAERCFGRALALAPKEAKLWSNRALVRYRQRRLDQARADFDRALALQPGLVEALVNRGLVRQAQGDLPGAVADFGAGIARAPAHAAAYVNRGKALRLLGRPREALADFDRALALDGRNADYHNARGLACLDLGRLDAARDDFGRAIELDPKNALAYHNRGLVRRRAGDLQGAVADYTQAIALGPGNSGAYFNRAYARVRLGELAGALADYGKVAELEPKNVEAWLNHGDVLSRLGRREEALADFDRVVALRPGWVKGHANRGSMLLALGRVPEAVGAFERALQADPKAWYVWFNLGLARSKQGDRPRAMAALKRAHELAPAERKAMVAQWVARLEK